MIAALRGAVLDLSCEHCRAALREALLGALHDAFDPVLRKAARRIAAHVKRQERAKRSKFHCKRPRIGV